MEKKNGKNLFGKHLEERRLALGMTLREVAEKIGHSVVYVRDVELGKRRPFNPDHFPRLAETLKTEISVLELLRARDLGMVEIPVRCAAGSTAELLLGRKDDLKAEESAMINDILINGRKK